jgi:hypothetical protein
LALAGVWCGYNRVTATGTTLTWQVASYKAALWAREHTEPEDIFALKDAGNFGYFSERRVVNLDGLVNNLEYQDVLNSRRLLEYFRQNHVKYLVLHGTIDSNPRVFENDYDRDSVAFRSLLYGTMSDPIPLRKCDEVYRLPYEHPSRDEFVIWDISSVVEMP